MWQVNTVDQEHTHALHIESIDESGNGAPK